MKFFNVAIYGQCWGLSGVISCYVLALFLTGCIPDGNAQENSETFYPIDFSVSSKGVQLDVADSLVFVAKNEQSYNDIWLTIPSISGDLPNPDFEKNQIVVILNPTVGSCGFSMEITSVEENEHTQQITVTEVDASAVSGDCAAVFEPRYHYAMVEFEKSHKPVSILHKARIYSH